MSSLKKKDLFFYFSFVIASNNKISEGRRRVICALKTAIETIRTEMRKHLGWGKGVPRIRITFTTSPAHTIELYDDGVPGGRGGVDGWGGWNDD